MRRVSERARDEPASRPEGRGASTSRAAFRRAARAAVLDRHGLFSRATIEDAYLQANLGSIRRRLHRFGLGTGLVFLLGGLVDWSVMGGSPMLATLLAMRLAVFAVGAYLALMVGRAGGSGAPRSSTLRDGLLAFELAVGLGVAVVMLGYRPDLAYRVVSVLALTMAVYVYMPVFAPANLWVLPVMGLLHLLELVVVFDPPLPVVGLLGGVLLLTHGLGWRMAVREGVARRQRWLMERRLRHEVGERRGAEKNLRHLLETCPMPLVVHRATDGEVVLANRAARRLVGLPVGRRLPADAQVARFFRKPEEYRKVLDSLRLCGMVRNLDVHLRTVDDRPLEVMLAARCLRYDGHAAVLSSLVEITARKQHERELRRLSATDPLTGLRNRRGFFAKADALLRRCDGEPIALLLMDVDHFKSINDTHGHAVGDLVLQMLAGRVKAVLRRPDVLARVGGEEFAILAPFADLDDACALAERVRDGVARHAMRIHGMRLQVTLSIGVSLVEPGRMAVDAAMSRADAAMYRAKRAGRNRVEHRADDPADDSMDGPANALIEASTEARTDARHV